MLLKKQKIVIFLCICVFVLITILRLTNNGQSYYYDRQLKSAKENILLREGQSLQSLTRDELLIDRSISVPHGNDWLDAVQKELRNVPFDYWIHISNQPESGNTDCFKYPQVFNLNFHNIYWQTYQRDNITFYLYGAYYDKRATLPTGPVVRVLAMTNRQKSEGFPPNFCQLWFENNTEPTLVPVLEYHSIYPDYWRSLPGYLYPYLITCRPQPTSDKRVPRTISLVKSLCETAKNNLRIWYDKPSTNMPKNGEFAVCVKGLNFPYEDISARLVEWLELLRIVGVSKVFMYNLGTHPNVTKVLSYYEKTGYVDIQPLTLAGGEPPLPHYMHQWFVLRPMNKRFNEFIPYNDCLYRNMYKYDYIAALDTDEMIMPLEPLSNWHQLIEKAMELQHTKFPKCEYGFAGICFLNTYFPDRNTNPEYQDVPKYMHMLRHTLRTSDHSSPNHATKCFHNTSTAHTIHNHFTLTWFKSCNPTTHDSNLAQLQHYRNPEDASKSPMLLLEDNSIGRFKEELVLKSQNVLKKLGFL